MEEKHDIMDIRSKQPDLNGDSSDLQRLLSKTFSSLRLFVDKNDPLSTKGAIARAHRELENYKRWRDSGSPISGVVMRLADGEEMSIIKSRSRMLAATCSVMDLLPGTVLNVYKKPDKYFGEVLLYTVEVSEIPPEGFTFRKTYPNNQSLLLHVQREEEGQLNVSIDYTPVPELACNGYSGWLRRIPILGSALLAFAGLLYLMGRRLRRETVAGQPSWTAGFAVVTSVLLFGFASLYWNSPEPNSANADSTQHVQLAGPPTSRPEETAQVTTGQTPSRMIGSDKANAPDYNDQPSVINTVSTQADIHTGGICDVSVNQKATKALANANTTPGPTSSGKVTTGRRKTASSPVAPLAKQRIQIYVKAFVKNDKSLEMALLHSFINELEQTDRFIVWTDAQGRTVPKGIYEVSLDFIPDEDCYGIILARLYNLNSKQIWDDAKDCHEYPKGKMLKITSKEMVSKILPLLADETMGRPATVEESILNVEG